MSPSFALYWRAQNLVQTYAIRGDTVATNFISYNQYINMAEVRTCEVAATILVLGVWF